MPLLSHISLCPPFVNREVYFLNILPTNTSSSISGPMTLALSCYSAVFMRYALAVSPKNYLLFGCHFINCASQLTQGYRFLNYWKFGGKELAEKAKAGAAAAQGKVGQAVDKARDAVGK